MLSGNGPSIALEIERAGQTLKVEIPRKYYRDMAFPRHRTSAVWLQDSIMHFRSTPKSRAAFDSLLRIALKSKGMIFDLRGTLLIPRNALKEAIYDQSKTFVLINGPDFSHPGKFHRIHQETVEVNDTDFYKGQVVILVNEYTQSKYEYFSMFLKQAVNSIIIGSQTAGSTGNITVLPLPGGFNLVFTALEVLWPDGSQTQSIGIQPDIYIKPTLSDIRNDRDVVLEKAIEYINHSQ